jgi:hypothetical protein
VLVGCGADWLGAVDRLAPVRIVVTHVEAERRPERVDVDDLRAAKQRAADRRIVRDSARLGIAFAGADDTLLCARRGP